MIRRFHLITMLCAAAFLYFGTPLAYDLASSYAQSPPAAAKVTDDGLHTLDKNGGIKKCETLPEAKGGVWLARIVPCIAYTIEVTTVKFSKGMITVMMPMFMAFLTFVITMFGVRVSQGQREIGPQAFLLTMKIALIFSMFYLIPNFFIPGAYGVISDGVQITTEALKSSSFDESCGKSIKDYGDDNTPKVWQQMDCVVGKLFGFATGTRPDGTRSANMVLQASTAGLLTGFLFGGTLGVSVFFALIGALWSVMWMVFKVVLAFINGYLIVCIMLLIAPIFMPLTLLKVTSDYFEKWWKAILGGILMPIIVAAYSMFALTMYDALLFKPDSKLQTLFDKVATSPALQHSTAPCDFNITNDPKFKGGANGTDMDKIIKSPFLQNFTQPLLSGGSNICGLLKAPVFKITDVKSDAFKEGQKVLNDLFIEAIKLFITGYLIAAGLGTVMNFISQFAGSSMASAALNARSETESTIAAKFNNIQQRMSNAFSSGGDKNGATGAAFLRSIPGAAQEAGGSITSTITDSFKDLVKGSAGTVNTASRNPLGGVSRK